MTSRGTPRKPASSWASRPRSPVMMPLIEAAVRSATRIGRSTGGPPPGRPACRSRTRARGTPGNGPAPPARWRAGRNWPADPPGCRAATGRPAPHGPGSSGRSARTSPSRVTVTAGPGASSSLALKRSVRHQQNEQKLSRARVGLDQLLEGSRIGEQHVGAHPAERLRERDGGRRCARVMRMCGRILVSTSTSTPRRAEGGGRVRGRVTTTGSQADEARQIEQPVEDRDAPRRPAATWAGGPTPAATGCRGPPQGR